MSDSPLTTAHRLLVQAIDTLSAAAESGATDDDLLSVLTLCEGTSRRLDRLTVATVSALERRGTFAERGYKSTPAALGDLLGWERFEARHRVVAAEQVCPRVSLDGTALPAKLPATAEVFAAGHTGLRHVAVIARVLASPAAERLTPQVWAGAEAQLAEKAAVYTPSELQTWGIALVEALDADGPEPDDRPPAPVNEVHLVRHRGKAGGTLKARFDDAAMFDAIATVIDAHARPVTADEQRSAAQRQAEALADVCGYVLDHADVPECGGRRPHLTVLVRLEDLENRARAACLDFGGTLSPESLRMLACDAAVVPVVLNGTGQPLDVGRATRTIPDGLRRHRRPRPRLRRLRPPTILMRGPPHHRLARRRRHRPAQLRDALPRVPPPPAPLRMGSPHPRRAPRTHPTRLDRPPAKTPPKTTPAPRRVRTVEQRGRGRQSLCDHWGDTCPQADAVNNAHGHYT